MAYGDAKSYSWSLSPISGATIPNQFSHHEIRGDVFRTMITSSHATGSVFINESGTEQTVLATIATSGTTPVIRYPRTYVANTAGTVVSNVASGGAYADLFVFNKLYVAGSGLTSGTSASLKVEVFYR